METRKVGRTGLSVTRLALGGWLTFGSTVDNEVTRAIVRAAWDLGINHFDTADIYAVGKGEETFAHALSGLPRTGYVLATKVFWPMGPGPNDRGLSRKHILESCHASLRRLRTDYVDIYYCHRFDPETPLEETVRAMEDLIAQGKVLYWGTSCFTAPQLREAHALAARYRPVVEQPRYNVFDRHIEAGVIPACAELGMGLHVWSPLAMGLLTGKYLDGVPPGSRAAHETQGRFFREGSFGPEVQAVVRRLSGIAREAGLTPAQLAIGWILRRPEITSVLLGATGVAQLEETAASTELPPDVLRAVEEVVRGAPSLGD